jgi:hypothetical protein
MLLLVDTNIPRIQRGEGGRESERIDRDTP